MEGSTTRAIHGLQGGHLAVMTVQTDGLTNAGAARLPGMPHEQS
jgi:hypothetical protein